MKECQRCKTVKPTTDFHRNRATIDGYNVWCASCKNAYRKSWNKTGKGTENMRRTAQKVDKVKRRNQRLLREYGVTSDWYDAQVVARENKCAICGGPPDKDRLFRVDHSHTTGVVRGLLCLHCNMRLGFLEDDEWVEKATRYLNLEWEIERVQNAND